MLPAILTSPARALLQDYPSQPLRLVVPVVEDSVFDTLTRALVTQLQQQVDREVGIEDRPAANDMATGETVARAPSDGRTLLPQQTTLVAQPALEPASYDPLRDFQPVAMMATLPLFLAIDAHLPIYSVIDLLAQTSGESVTVNCGSDTVGTWSHLVVEQFVRNYAFHAPHVAVRGEAGLVQRILAGRMTARFARYPSVAAAAANGQLRLLGVTGGIRSRFAPAAPTLREGGLAGFDHSARIGSFIPACTPRSFSMRAAVKLRRAVASGDVHAMLRAGGSELKRDAPDTFAQAVRHDTTRW